MAGIKCGRSFYKLRFSLFRCFPMARSKKDRGLDGRFPSCSPVQSPCGYISEIGIDARDVVTTHMKRHRRYPSRFDSMICCCCVGANQKLRRTLWLPSPLQVASEAKDPDVLTFYGTTQVFQLTAADVVHNIYLGIKDTPISLCRSQRHRTTVRLFRSFVAYHIT